jgi:hypothetical protein
MNTVARRTVLLGGLGLLVLPRAASADGSCGPWYGGQQPCTVGLPGLQVTGRNVVGFQEKQNWCWAACIAGVFAWYGRTVAQQRIVERLFGTDIDRAASTAQIFGAVRGVWADQYGQSFVAQANPLIDADYSFSNPLAAARMSQDLLNNCPLIVGTQGHATILTAMSWVNFAQGGQRITDLTVRDPWPLNPRRRSLSASEFANIGMLMQVRVG